MKRTDIKTFFVLHLLIAFFSVSEILSKKAGAHDFLSPPFILCYGGVIVILGIYAIAWQQIIKHMPLSVAYANKAVTVIWGIIWGIVFFKEHITAGKIIGAVIVIAGVVMYALSEDDGEAEHNG